MISNLEQTWIFFLQDWLSGWYEMAKACRPIRSVSGHTLVFQKQRKFCIFVSLLSLYFASRV
jgi:hypothetical protein